jgi:hypothetical protein
MTRPGPLAEALEKLNDSYRGPVGRPGDLELVRAAAKLALDYAADIAMRVGFHQSEYGIAAAIRAIDLTGKEKP